MTKAKVNSDRKSRWEALLEEYKVQHPEKYEAKKKAGEFKEIPDSFQ